MHSWGGFAIDAARREVRRDGALVHLEPQAFDVLLHLVEHRDRVIPKTELLDEVWGHRFTSEASLTTRIKEARRAVGDDGRQQHTIANVRGRGYRFVAELIEDGAAEAGATLVGRHADLSTLVELVGAAPLVTLTGPGGVGKSSLARAVARRVRDRYQDGTRMVELAPLDVGSRVVPAVARALNIVAEDEGIEDATRAIARRDALLVLDNCEHVIDHAAALVEQISHADDRRVALLATSQVRLGSSGEIVVPLHALDVDAAIELFFERARAVCPSSAFDTVDRHRVAQLVSALDRLPLTVEMAAARLGSLTFDELEQAVARERPLLQMTHRSPTPRHRSLPSIVEWSANLLAPDEREVFTGFAVFAGAVSAADADAIIGDGSGSTLFTLASLAERSLLATTVHGAETRFGMLTTVRAVARRWLDDSGTAAATRRRHATHVLDALQDVDDRVRTSDEPAARERLVDITDEVRAAHRWAREHDPALASQMTAALFHPAYSTLWFEPADWSRALLAQEGSPAAHAADVLMTAGVAANRGDLVASREQATAVAQGSDGRLRGSALEVLSDVALYQGATAVAVERSAELVHLGHELSDRHCIAVGTVNTALARAYAGDPEGALRLLDAIDIPDVGPTDAAWLAYARGEALSEATDAGAPAALLDAIQLGNSVANHFVVVVGHDSLATAYARLGNLDLALDAFVAALHRYRRHGNHTHAIQALYKLALLFESVGDDEGAVMVIGACTAARRHVPFAAEPETVTAMTDAVRRRVGTKRFDAWLAIGRALEIDVALRIAAERAEQNRH